MKKLLLLVLFQLLFVDVAYGLVKLKDVTQKGAGSVGTVRIEFNGNYKRSKADVEYKSDHVEVIMKDVFSLPPNRVFKVSSDKSSVSKITSKLVPGNIIRLSIYFKIPLDIIQRTGSLELDRNILKFTYRTTFDEPAAAVEDTPSTVQAATEGSPSAETPKEEKALDAYYQSISDNGPEEAKLDENVIAAPEEKTLQKKETGIKRIWGVLKGVFILALVVAFSIGVFYLYKRYSSGMSESLSTPFGRSEDLGRMAAAKRTNPVASQPPIIKPSTASSVPSSLQGSDIRVLSSLTLDHGKTVHVVEYMGEKMLIATSKDNVTLLSRLDTKTASSDEPDLFKNTKFKDRFGSDF